MAGRRIEIQFLGKDVSAGKTATQVEGRVSRMSGKLQRAGDVAGKLLVGGLVAGGAAMIRFGNQASDLGETQSKVNQIFGKDGARNLDNFASAAAKNMGQSKQMALDAAATFGMFGKAAGQSGIDLVNFSTRMTVLASDMASFNNTSPEQAIEAIGAALRGESEPIRAYGVMLNEAALKAEALSLGLLKPVKDSPKIKSAYMSVANAQRVYNEAVKEHGKGSLEARTANAKLGSAQAALKKATDGTLPPLTQQQKILAAQSAIMKQTKDQQGDFARTSDGLANKQRVLKAEFENVTTQLGTKALPIMLKVTDWAMKAIDWMEKHQTLVKVLGVVVGTLAGGLWLLSKAQMAVNLAMSLNPIGLVVIAIAALVAGVIIAYKKSETFRNIVKGAFNAVADAGEAMWAALKTAFRWIVDKFLWVGEMIIKGAAKAFGWVPGIGPKLKTAAEKFEQFRKDVNAQLDGVKPAEIKVKDGEARRKMNSFKEFYLTQIGKMNDANVTVGMAPGSPGSRVPGRASGGPVTAGRPYIVGERRPELFVPNRSGRIVPRVPAAGAGSEHFSVTAPLVIQMDGKNVWQGLLKVKRDRGGIALGLA